jgi:hypothetical protein
MRSTRHVVRRIERVTYVAARGLAPAQNSARASPRTSQSRLNTIEANQPVAIAIIAVARP